MKKRFLSLLIFVFMLSQIVLPASASSIDSINATIESGSKIVTVTGAASAGSGRQIMISVADQDGKFCYLEQDKTLQNGSFEFKFPIPSAAAGSKYTVRVWGQGVNELTATFNYTEKGTSQQQSGQVTSSTAGIDLITLSVNGSVIKASSTGKKDDAIVSVDGKTLEKAFLNAATDSKGNKSITINLGEINANSVKLPLDVLSKGNSNSSIRLNTPVGEVNLPCSLLYSNNSAESGKDAVISLGAAKPLNLEAGVKNVIGNRPIVEIKTLVDNKPVVWNSKALVAVSLNYKPTAEELKDPEFITVWGLNSDGTKTPVISGRYDASAGKVVFSTGIAGQYSVVSVHKTFDDLDKFGWARKPVEVMASKGVINGISENKYDPTREISRADFAVLLTKTLELKGSNSSNFDDIKGIEYFSNAVGTLKALGIANGTGNNRFNPMESISRQDMMVMVDKALEAKGIKSEGISKNVLAAFKDNKAVSAYASGSVARLVESGIISGEGGSINPSGSATRAQTAVIIYKLYNNYVIK